MGIVDREAVHQDDGISIIEALVSCVLIGLIAATAVPAFIGFYGGIKETKTENNAMNLGQAMILEATSYERLPQGSSKCVPLLNGRPAGDAALLTHWQEGQSDPDVANLQRNTTQAGNPSGCDPAPAVPFRGVTRNIGSGTGTSYRLGNIDYDVRTWISQCIVELTLNETVQKNSQCTDVLAKDPNADLADPKYHKAYRVVTRVTWEGNGCSKKNAKCKYVNAVTLEADKDQVFYEYTKGAPDVTRAPIRMCVVKNTSALIDFLANIKANFSPKPIRVHQPPSQGSLNTQQDTKLGRAIYTPNRGYVGTDTIAYRVQNSIGTWSDAVTLTITVKDSCLP